MASMLQRVSTGTSLALAAVLLYLCDRALARPWVPWSVAGLLAVSSSVEIAGMGRLAQLRLGYPLAVVTIVLALATFPLDLGFGPARPWWVNGATAAVIAGGYAWLRHRLNGTGAAGAPLWSAGLAAWLLPALFGLVEIRTRFGSSGLLAFVALAKIGDNAGYFVGRFFGRIHPFPRLSPGKTLEGCVASLLGAVLLGAALAAAGWLPTDSRDLGLGACLGAITNLAAQAGDLLESWVKRRAGVKDSGRWLGASGGVLDVLDSLLLSVPVVLTCWPALL